MSISEWENRIILGDCLELMRELPDKSVDLVLTDPPYGINESNEKNATRGCRAIPTDYGHYTWDSKKLTDNCMHEIKRVSRNQVIFGGNYYGSVLGDTSCYIVWDKDNGTTDFADCELAWTSFKTATRKIRHKWHGMLQEHMGRHKERRVHPTQKPVGVMTWILANYSSPNDLVLDPFMGSGTTAVACHRTGRRFIGMEIEPKYHAMACERVRLEQMQLKLELTY